MVDRDGKVVHIQVCQFMGKEILNDNLTLALVKTQTTIPNRKKWS